MKNFENFQLKEAIRLLNEKWDLTFMTDFIELIDMIDSPISNAIYNIDNVDNEDNDVNFISITDKDGYASYLSDKKIDKEYKREHGNEPYNSSDREEFAKEMKPIEIKVGRLIQKLMTLYTDQKFSASDIEKFVNKFIALQNTLKGVDWKILKGKNILKGYNSGYYSKVNEHSDGSELYTSCMVNKEDQYKGILDLYTQNPEVCSLLTLRDKKDKITGRCILWITEDINGKEYKIMDRIYTIREYDIETFKEWAKKNGYYSRRYFSNGIIDCKMIFLSPTGGQEKLSLFVKPKKLDFNLYPYVDSFSYANREDNIMSNDYNYIIENYDDKYIILDNVQGEHSGNDNFNRVRTINDEIVFEDSAVFSHHHDGYILKKNAIKTYISFIGQDLVDKTVIKLIDPNKNYDTDKNLTDLFVKNNIVIKEFKKEYVFPVEECVWSKFHKSWILQNDSIFMEEDGDWILDDDDYIKEYKKSEKKKNKLKKFGDFLDRCRHQIH